jgi:hypothetical protein
MRLADDLSDSTASPALSAPTGLPAPTGQLPATLPRHLPPNPTVGPRLPPRGPRTASPTGQVPTTTTSLPTTAAAAAFAALTGAVPVITAGANEIAPRKRGAKKWIALVVFVAALGTAAYVMRDSAYAHRITGEGYDHNALPSRSFPQPVFTGAEFTSTVQTVGIDDGLPTNYWEIERADVNYAAGAAKVTMDEAKATIIGGSIGTAQSTAPTEELIVDEQATYAPGQTPADAWTRTAHDTGAEVSVLSRNEVRMYQDVVDPALRAQQPAKTLHEVRHGIPVTTYEYATTFGQFYEVAPHLYDFASALDGNAADDAAVTITLSFDEQWVVRYVDVAVDFHSVIDHIAKANPAHRYPYRISVDVISTTDQPEAVVIPTITADSTIPETTTAVP